MKYIYTLLFALMLCGAKAQVPDTTIALPNVIVAASKYSCVNCFTEVNTNRTCNLVLNENEKKSNPKPNTPTIPAIPVDMMVRHYFAISYWD